ncbi:phage tail protein [Yersinia bercovieri]|uniref:phage tail protein n=1 Tax=Yersinia bercovieri TaxID=634 RepID=UPI0021BD9987|nr:phage tail protein [Yersinia bercovieri]
MTVKYFALLTNLGAAKLANAAALGTPLQITHMAVGDGGGALPIPNPAQTQLVGEKRRAALNSLSIDEANSSQIIAEQVIPETDGGWWIREVGLFDKDGILIAIANCPETYKPQLQEGSGRTQTVRMVLIVSSTDTVTLKIDPSVVLATRKYADDKAIEVKKYADGLLSDHEASRNHPDASKTEKGFVKLSSAINSDSEALAATPKAVKTVSDNALKIANNLSEIAAAGPAAVSATLANLSLAPHGFSRFTSNGSFTVPANVTRIWVSGCAAGGGGGSSLATNSSSFVTGGSGGGAGQSAMSVPIIVTPGQVIPVTIGTGGTGATAATNNATAGGNTQLGAGGSLMNLGGGSPGSVGGGGSTYPSNFGGPGGGAGYPTGDAAQDTSSFSATTASGGQGGQGASGPFGQAGPAGRGAKSNSPSAGAGFGYGAGGSGAGGAYTSTISAPGGGGASGLNGYLVIEW